MTNQDKLIKQLTRVVLRMAVDVDYLLGRVHEFGPHKSGNQSHVARRVAALRASAEKLESIADSKPQSRSRGSK